MRIVLQDVEAEPIQEIGLVTSSVVPRIGEQVRYKRSTYTVDDVTHVYPDEADAAAVFVICAVSRDRWDGDDENEE